LEEKKCYKSLNGSKAKGSESIAVTGLGERVYWDFYLEHQDIAYASASMVYRLLKKEGLLYHWAEPYRIGPKPDLPTAPNQKWHTDLMVLDIDGYNYYYQGILDAYIRYIIAWDIHAEGTALNTGLLLQVAYDKLRRESIRWL